MSHRASFVVIEGGAATAYEDDVAAIACTFQLAEGEAVARRLVEDLFQPATELQSWAFAEAGYLMDLDERACVAFGRPTLDPATLGKRQAAAFDALLKELDAGWPAFVAHIAAGWRGWTLIWDERGVDAFAEHLARRGITSIATAPRSHPRSLAPRSAVTVTVDAPPATTKAATKKAATKQPAKKAATKKAATKKAATKKAATKKRR